MADGTKIEWSEATWNPITGCSLASPGCTNCYAMDLAGTRLADLPSRAGLTREVNGNHVWTGEVRFNEQWLDQPLRWKRPRMIFVCAHGDLFHESVPDEWIDKIFAVMALCPQHTFQVLTKRSARMRDYCQSRFETEWGSEMLCEAIEDLDRFNSDAGGDHDAPLPNVWLGVSVEDQQRADERIPDLLATPAAVRWISAEPLLGPVDLTRRAFPQSHYEDWLRGHAWDDVNGDLTWDIWEAEHGPKLDWVVVGGESGRSARPMHPDWARSLRDQCVAAGVPFFFKQWGEWRETDGPKTTAHNRLMAQGTHWLTRDGQLHHRSASFSIYHEYLVAKLGKKRAGRLLDGVEHNAMPGASHA